MRSWRSSKPGASVPRRTCRQDGALRTRMPPIIPTATVARRPYVRARDLPRLIALWPREIADESPQGRLRLLRKLRQTLREERRRGIAGHWCYDLARHAALLAAYRHEVASSRATTAAAPVTAPHQAVAVAASRVACPGPSSWPAASAPPRSSAPPSGSRAPGSTSPGTRPATACNGCADAASAT